MFWVYGLFSAGTSEINTFRTGLKNVPLEAVEFAIVERCQRPPPLYYEHFRRFALMRARHERMNALLKFFNVQHTHFRQNVKLHGICFHVGGNITAITLDIEPLLDVNES